MGDLMKYDVDYSGLSKTMTKKAYRLSEVKDQLETVAFDIVKFKDQDQGANLWQIQSADDGDYIVALYEPEEDVKVASPWGVLVTKLGELQISYKNDPIIRMSSAKLGIPADQLNQIEHYLPEKLATNKKLVKLLLKELNEPARQAVAQRYPELS
jgi:hypothetical protein